MVFLKNKNKGLALCLVASLAILPFFALAETSVRIPNPLGDGPDDPQALAKNLTNYALTLAGSLAVIFIIWGGISMIMAGGSKDKYTKGLKTLEYALIGLAIVFLSYAIVYAVTKLVLEL